MLLESYRRKNDVWLASCTRVDPITARSIEIATDRAAAALRAGLLLSSVEAMLMAGPEARCRETLFSIACAVARENAADQDEILGALERRFKSMR